MKKSKPRCPKAWICTMVLALLLPAASASAGKAPPSAVPQNQRGEAYQSGAQVEKIGGYMFRFKVPVKLESLPGSPAKAYVFCLVLGGLPPIQLSPGDGGSNGDQDSNQQPQAPKSIGIASVELPIVGGSYQGPSPVTVEITEMVEGNPADAEGYTCWASLNPQVDPNDLKASFPDVLTHVGGAL